MDQAETLGDVRIKRFSASPTTNRYVIDIDSATYAVSANVRTASRIAAWHHDGEFWLALRMERVGQEVEMFHSVDGAIWSHVVGNVCYSDVGPSAVSYWTGDNYLVGLQ